jgi:FdhD protein
VALSETPVRRPTTNAQVVVFDESTGVSRRPDRVVTEEPLEIRVSGPNETPVPFAVTMRTPGNDFELAAGLCRSEGLVAGPDGLESIAYCLGGDGEQLYNVVTVQLRHPVAVRARERRFLANSSCGICGKAALDEVEQRGVAPAKGPTVGASTVLALPDTLAEHQRIFGQTGGLHAAARFSASGELLTVREDVGRHNALDKLIGNAFLEQRLPLSDDVLLVSGRLSFELVQKAAIGGIGVLCAVSAPSSLAVAAAEEFEQTIIGFVRDGRFNIYTRADRVDLAA